MMHKIIYLPIFLLLVTGCSTKKGMMTYEPTVVLKPLKQIELEKSALPQNLKVVVRNVADNAYSNKNYFRLYVNGELIQPQNKINNTTSDYLYELQLQPGFYEIKGSYYWYDGWQENRTDIKTEQLVRVDEKGQTLVTKDIPKNQRGIVEAKKLLFDVNYKSFQQPTQLATVDTTEKTTPTTDINLSGRKRTKLQIHTDPANCDVYINDELVGRSPISWWVTFNEPHVVQVRHDGYRTGIRVVVPEEMMREEKLIIIQRLESLPGFKVEQPPISVVDTLTTETSDTTAVVNP